MSSKRNRDLSGYIWSPKRAGYFDDLPTSETGFSQIQNVCTSLSEVNGFQSYKPKSKNLLQCIASRQGGCIDASVFQREVLSLRLDGLQTVDNFSFPYDTRSYDVKFLKEGTGCIYGLWKSGVHDVLGKIDCGLLPNPPYIMVRGTRIIGDICVQDNCLLWISKESLTANISSILIIVGEGVEEVYAKYFVGTFLRCCAGSSAHNRCAIGMDKGVALYKTGERFVLLKHKLKSTIVCSLEYDTNDSGNILLCGNMQGQLFTIDFRNNSHFKHQVTSGGSINDIKILSQGYDCILSTNRGILCRFDSRKNGNVLQFHGHVPAEGKNRLSVREDHDLLCATGGDGVTRLWSLRLGGLPLKCIPPEHHDSPCRSMLVAGGTKCSIYTVQKNEVKVYEFKP